MTTSDSPSLFVNSIAAGVTSSTFETAMPLGTLTPISPVKGTASYTNPFLFHCRRRRPKMLPLPTYSSYEEQLNETMVKVYCSLFSLLLFFAPQKRHETPLQTTTSKALSLINTTYTHAHVRAGTRIRPRQNSSPITKPHALKNHLSAHIHSIDHLDSRSHHTYASNSLLETHGRSGIASVLPPPTCLQWLLLLLLNTKAFASAA